VRRSINGAQFVQASVAYGLPVVAVFLNEASEAESHAPLVKSDQTVLPYHSQKERAYFSIFGKCNLRRAYFYAWGGSDKRHWMKR